MPTRHTDKQVFDLECLAVDILPSGTAGTLRLTVAMTSEMLDQLFSDLRNHPTYLEQQHAIFPPRRHHA